MNGAISRKVRLWYGIFLSVLTAAVAILFIVQVSRIYFGEIDPEVGQKFSREIVGQKLKEILIPIIIWLVAVVGGYVLSVIYPHQAQKKSASTAHTALKRLKKRIPNGQSEEFLAEKKRYNRMEGVRIGVWSAAAAFALASAIVAIVYLANTSYFDMANFSSDVETTARINTIVIRMVKNVMPWVAASLVLFIGASLYEHFSAKRELERVKRLLVLGKGAPVEESVLIAKRDAALSIAGSWQTKLILRLALFAVAVIFIVIGIIDGGYVETFEKAAAICKECIGLG